MARDREIASWVFAWRAMGVSRRNAYFLVARMLKRGDLPGPVVSAKAVEWACRREEKRQRADMDWARAAAAAGNRELGAALAREGEARLAFMDALEPLTAPRLPALAGGE